MVLWLVFALMVAAAIFAVLWPLYRRGLVRGGSEIAVYRDQLDEIARDRASGQIGEAEAEAAKVEVSRRLLAAADAAETEKAASAEAPGWRRRATAIAGFLLLPIGATALYIALGSPQMPGEPLAERLRAVHQDRSIERLVAQAEVRLERNPDARGYEVLAPTYLRLGRFADAVNAHRKLLVLAGENAERQSALGEALAAAGNGIISPEAKAAFERALMLDPADLKARFFTGIAAEQGGDRAQAAEIWRGMLAAAPPGAPWVESVQQALARVGGSPPPIASAPAPNPTDVSAAANMSENDRAEMINGMVARLADRLKENAGDIEGWQRLLRAYMVLGRPDKAHAAAADARRALASEPDKLRRIDDMTKSLGLESLGRKG
ncbi:MAG: c-type cytochrome biogenesis protein CcmI [Deltaproteobacteria bacterium]|nr:c-type cytochrome biogenesis protein CcmI [Deltaproteobacteria bacterium]